MTWIDKRGGYNEDNYSKDNGYNENVLSTDTKDGVPVRGVEPGTFDFFWNVGLKITQIL